MTKERIAAIRAEIAAATEGPWTVEDDGNMNSMKYRIVQYHADRIRREQGIVTSARHQYHALVKTKEDAQLIARAPYNLGMLLDEVERLTEIVESTDSDEMLAIQRLTALVEKMNAERATIFQKGAEAMRQAAVLASRENIGCRHVLCHSCESPAAVIRALPTPEYKS